MAISELRMTPPPPSTSQAILELVAHPDSGVDVGRVEVAAGHTVVHSAVHRADVSVEVHVKSVVSVEGKSVETSAADAVRGCRAARLRSGAVGVLMSAVI